jgi:hypothetical protein
MQTHFSPHSEKAIRRHHAKGEAIREECREPAVAQQKNELNYEIEIQEQSEAQTEIPSCVTFSVCLIHLIPHF